MLLVSTSIVYQKLVAACKLARHLPSTVQRAVMCQLRNIIHYSQGTRGQHGRFTCITVTRVSHVVIGFMHFSLKLTVVHVYSSLLFNNYLKSGISL